MPVRTDQPQPDARALLIDQKEFFAETTECYFGSNNFYPFVTGELKQAEPELFALLEEIWGSLPGRAKSGGKAKP